MFRPQFHIEMRKQRERFGLTQSAAAKLCGLTSDRWCHLEIGFRNPSEDEFKTLCSKLGIKNVSTGPKSANRELRKNGNRRFLKAKRYFAPRDRESYVRYRAAQKSYPTQMRQLGELVWSRPDAPFLEYFCHNVQFDSGLEVLFLMHLLAQGAKPMWGVPLALGHLPHPVIDPRNFEEVGQRQHLCLGREDTIYFLQVTFRCTETIRVDILRRYRGGWSVVELNGRGHDGSKDSFRALLLGLPVLQINEAEVVERVTYVINERESGGVVASTNC